MPDIFDAMDPASFRGVSFLVPSRDFESGRRGEIAEQPQSDVAYGSDMGRRAFAARVTGWVFTHDGYGARDALIGALDAFGPGRYVDPWGKQYRVKVARWSVAESTARGGLAEFQIEFAEDGEQAQSVSSSVDTGYQAIAAGRALAQTAKDVFVAVYVLRGVPEFVRSAGLAVLADFASVFLSDASLWGGADALALSDARSVFETGGDAESLSSGVVSGVAQASASLPDGPARTRFLFAAADYRTVPVAPLWSTPNRRAAQGNQQAVAALIRRAALAELAVETPLMRWESYDAAAAYASAANDSCMAEMRLAGGRDAGLSSHQAFAAVAHANAMIGQDARARGGQLARLSNVQLTGVTPAAILAYRLYDDSSRAGDLARRNNISDLNWLPPSRPLEVLSK